MAVRGSTLQNNTATAITREIDSRYDLIKRVSEHLDDIAFINEIDLDALVSQLEEALDFSGITVVSGSPASWNPSTKVLTVPTIKGDKGDTGDTGENGLTPIYEFTYNETTGNLEYTLTGYENQTSESIGDIVDYRLGLTKEW